MPTGKDRQNAAEGSHPNLPAAPLRGAAMAAGLLEAACTPGTGDSLRLEVVCTLARDLAEELEALAVMAEAETSLVEGALRAADVANLAACTLPDLPEPRVSEAAAAVYLAAGAARALCTLAGAAEESSEHRQNVFGDTRSASWRAQFAMRQVDEFFEGEG